jgi:hypothetical protein
MFCCAKRNWLLNWRRMENAPHTKAATTVSPSNKPITVVLDEKSTKSATKAPAYSSVLFYKYSSASIVGAENYPVQFSAIKRQV